MREALTILPCANCGSPGQVRRQGPLLFLIMPKCRKGCELHKHPQTNAHGSIASICRTGVCLTKRDAIEQWNRMQVMNVRKVHA